MINLLNKFWDESVWLPPNTTWEQIAPGPDKNVVYTDHRHLLYPLPLALVLVCVRFLLEKYCFAPIGRYLGIKNARAKRAQSNPKLEAVYLLSPKLKHKQDLFAVSLVIPLLPRHVRNLGAGYIYVGLLRSLYSGFQPLSYIDQQSEYIINAMQLQIEFAFV